MRNRMERGGCEEEEAEKAKECKRKCKEKRKGRIKRIK